MLEDESGFSRAGILLPRAGNGLSARAGAGEADVFSSRFAAARASATEEISPEAAGDRIATLIDAVLAHPELELAAMHRVAARSGAYAAWPDRLDDRLLAALHSRDLPRAYRHQAEAIDHVLAGRDVVIATGTASGKSLCFQLPILQAALADPRARALLLFPTKALARDQCESLRSLVAALPTPATIGVGPYDGDTPPDERRAARARAHAVATNPDMLHRGVLPYHEGWGRFLAGLRIVVIDELHMYRGLFGSHVANVLRRLLRVCAHYGARPVVVACSATIANPVALAEALVGRPGFAGITDDGAPAGPRTFVVANPRIVDATTGVRRDYLKVTRVVASEVRRAGVQSLLFCRTRKAVELLTRYLQDDERRDGAATAAQSIRGYRGGYLPQRRREVEHALRQGEARMVATTHALELGIDVGGVDAVVLSGYPGSRAATLQRAGRAGRRGRPSLCVLVLSSLPTDQFIAADPSFLFDRPAEHAAIDPDNPDVLLPHLRCAAQELPLVAGAPFGPLAPADVALAAEHLEAGGALVRGTVDDTGGVAWLSAQAESAAEQVDLRGPIEENFAVVDEAGDVLAEVAYEDGPLYLHPGAIHAIEGRTFEVRALDWDARKATVRAVAADYYTEAIPKLRVRVVHPSAGAAGGIGDAHVVRTVPGFKKIRFDTHENIGFGPVHLPDLELHTRAAFWPLPRAFVDRPQLDPIARAGAAIGAGHAIHHGAALMLMCDAADLGHAITAGSPDAFVPSIVPWRGAPPESVLAAAGRPTIVLYDRVPGGAGLATTAFALGAELFARVAAMVRGCPCRCGCPTCLGPHIGAPVRADGRAIERAANDVVVDRELVLGLLADLQRAAEGPAA